MIGGEAQSRTESGKETGVRNGAKSFRLFIIVGVVLVASFLISRWAVWYGNEISIPRYCADPKRVIDSLRSTMTGAAAESGENRRMAMVAAKLFFLMPRESGETADAYIERIRYQLGAHCK